MVKWQLPTGKTILITMDEWFDMTDEKIQKKISEDAGTFINDPFANFDARDKNDSIEGVNEEIPIIEIPNEDLEDIKKELEN